MEAKDTVMNPVEMAEAITDNTGIPMGRAVAEAQAELSFAAGKAEAARKVIEEVEKIATLNPEMPFRLLPKNLAWQSLKTKYLK